MKDKLKIIIPVVIILVLGALAVYFLAVKGGSTGGNSSLDIKSSADLVSLVDKIYSNAQPEVMSLASNEIDLSDEDTVNYVTGLANGDKLEYLVVSEPMMTSVAYSLMLAKVKSGVDANAVAKELFDSVDPRKWICVAAEKVYATSSGDVVCLVMASENDSKKVYDEFKKIAGNTNKEYQKDGEIMEDFGGFDDMGGIEIPVDDGTQIVDEPELQE